MRHAFENLANVPFDLLNVGPAFEVRDETRGTCSGRGIFPNSSDAVVRQLTDHGVLEIIRDVERDLIPHMSGKNLANSFQNFLLRLVFSVDCVGQLRQQLLLLAV